MPKKSIACLNKTDNWLLPIYQLWIFSEQKVLFFSLLSVDHLKDDCCSFQCPLRWACWFFPLIIPFIYFMHLLYPAACCNMIFFAKISSAICSQLRLKNDEQLKLIHHNDTHNWWCTCKFRRCEHWIVPCSFFFCSFLFKAMAKSISFVVVQHHHHHHWHRHQLHGKWENFRELTKEKMW